ncbi:Histone acetyltransferase type B catalytic subunit [Choanephora cucurbitarum]|uniref:Histone acetyltransferase type B catalytic subunit n=1 Tax=Choanephora cucurbitarum TaxID=101091 RepID=A0A1C7N465_9FUNG|nr:Histone acetyltransferase type B catalytic subunit [Choanephora cucurbitarum]
MEPDIQPHPAATKVVDFADWACNTNDAIEISLVTPQRGDVDSPEPVCSTSFHPEFTYPIFGDHETAFGYKDLAIRIRYTSGSLRPYLTIDYSDKYTPSTVATADNISKTLSDYLPSSLCFSNQDEFIHAVKQDFDTFEPLGEKIHEYTRESDNGSVEHFEIYKNSFSSEKFKAYHARMQLFVLLFIEGSSYIESDDEKWEIYTLFKREKTTESKYAYHFVGYCTAYPFYCWPENTRIRISQFLVLPPYKKKGHGSKLYQTVYELFKSRLDVCEMTVEDPNEEFSDMRDKNDIRYLLEHKALNGLKAPVSAEKIEELCSTFKLTNRQTQRCIEMYLLSNVNKLNSEEYRQYRLQVKARLYTFNFDVLRDMNEEERKERLHQTYLGVEEDYHRLLEII